MTTEAYTAEQISELLRPVMSTDDSRPHMQRAHAVEIDGARWHVASNGHALAGIRSDVPVAPLPEGMTDMSAGFASVIPRGEAQHTVDVAVLRSWTGEPIECRTCYGAGVVEHTCSEPGCFDRHEGRCRGGCMGIGRVMPRTVGEVGATKVECYEVWRVLKTLPACVNTVDVLVASEFGPVRFSAPGWFAFVMGMRTNVGGETLSLTRKS